MKLIGFKKINIFFFLPLTVRRLKSKKKNKPDKKKKMSLSKKGGRFSSRKVLNTAIDSVIEEQKAKEGKYEEKEDDEESLSLRLKGKKGEEEEEEKLKGALTMAEIYCDPLLDEKSDFLPFSVPNLKTKFLELTKKRPSLEEEQPEQEEKNINEPRLEYSILKGTEDLNPLIQMNQLKASRKITVKTEEGEEEDEYETIQEIYFKSNPNLPRIAIGVFCTSKNNKPHLEVKNIPITNINSQYYLIKAIYTLRARRITSSSSSLQSQSLRPIGSIETEERWVLFFDAAMRSNVVNHTFLKGTDTIFLNLKMPEEIERSFATIEELNQFYRKRVDILNQELLRLKIQVQNSIADLELNHKNEIIKILGKHRFIGAVDKLAECYLKGFDQSGEWKEDDYTNCVKEIARTNEFIKTWRSVTEKPGYKVDQTGQTIATALGSSGLGISFAPLATKQLLVPKN